MPRLVHTGLWVPTDRVRVTNLQRIDIGTGTAWSGEIRNGRPHLGVIANDGDGSATQFHPSTERTRSVMAGFVAQCRSHDGEPLPEEFVVDALVEEHDYANDVVQAEHHGRYLVRSFDEYDIPELRTFYLAGSTPPDYEAAFRATSRLSLSKRTVRAELWMGAAQGWVELPSHTR